MNYNELKGDSAKVDGSKVWESTGQHPASEPSCASVGASIKTQNLSKESPCWQDFTSW